MTGTANHEGIAGVLGAIEYFEWVGETFGEDYEAEYSGRFSDRKLRLKQSMAAIRDYEYDLSRVLLDILAETPGVTVYGLRDTDRVAERVPTVSFNLKGWVN
jgi:selenocysteine lyase/cysteine desulfurase